MQVIQDSLVLYRNPDTAVQATFEREDPRQLAGLLPATVQAVGVRFRLRWPRPRFFAQEAVPILIELADAKRLLVAFPQSGGAVMRVINPTPAEVTRIWQAGSAAPAKGRSSPPLPFMSSERSDRWWRYQWRKQELQRRLGQDVFVPTLVGVATEGRSDELHLQITWTDAVPLVIPECDFITLLEGAIPSEFKVRGTASHDDVRRALAPFLDTIDVEDVGTLPLLKPKQAKRARSVFQSLPVRQVIFRPSDPGAWMDVR